MNATIEPDVVLDSCAVLRTARKPWRCVCFAEFRSFTVRASYATGWTEKPFPTRSEATRYAAEVVGREADAAGHQFLEAEVIPRPNPNHRTGCRGRIEPGDRYVEYVGEAAAWESGSRYCLPCGVATWAVTS